MNETELLKQEIQELKDWKKSLEVSHSIPLNIDQSFRKRFSGLGNSLSVSAKGTTTENKVVNEAGAANYSVMTIPDGFVQVTIASNIYYLPYFS